MVGVWNILVTHSGWDLKIGTDPREHFIHHNYNFMANYGLLLDPFFGTNNDASKYDEKYFQFEKEYTIPK